MIIRSQPLVEERFRSRIDDQVAIAIATLPVSFEALLRALPGVYPLDVLAALARLVSAGRMCPNSEKQLSLDASTRIYRQIAQSDLPVPHPLDFEWRFTKATSRWLLGVANDLATKGAPVLLYGTPGVALEATVMESTRKITFVGDDNAVTQSLSRIVRAREANLRVQSCNVSAIHDTVGAVILDPPWYVDFIRPMLRGASAASQMGGAILVTLPPPGARARADEDRRTLESYAQRVGLEVMTTLPLRAEYETPFFERNALRANGVSAPPAWRRGDVVVFRKVRSIGSAPLGRRRPREWAEVSIGRMRLFVRRSTARPTNAALLSSVVENDVLPSVSRRDARRLRAEVWTSGNRIFGSTNPELVALAATLAGDPENINRSLQGMQVVDRDAIERLSYALSRLADVEAAEDASSALGLAEGASWTSISPRLLNKLGSTASG